jgi:hypothetical protein
VEARLMLMEEGLDRRRRKREEKNVRDGQKKMK